MGGAVTHGGNGSAAAKGIVAGIVAGNAGDVVEVDDEDSDMEVVSQQVLTELDSRYLELENYLPPAVVAVVRRRCASTVTL
jgi:hypothetical protein